MFYFVHNVICNYCDFWTLNCVIPQLRHFHDADDYWCNKSEWTILKVAFLVFVPAVAANDFVKNMILAPNVGPLWQTQQLKLLKTLMPQTFSKICKISKICQTSKISQILKNSWQLEVVPSPAEVCQNDPDGYQAAAFVPSKVPRWRSPPYLNILIPEHHITPHMIKVNVMAKLKTVPDSALSEIEEYLGTWTFKVKNRRIVKIDSRRNFDILNSKSEKRDFWL